MAQHTLFIVSIVQFIYIIYISQCTTSSHLFQNDTNLRFRIVHRDSSLSPIYNPNATEFDIIQEAYQRTMTRLQYYSQRSTISPNTPTEIVYPATGEYIMSYSLGTPPQQAYGILDTGSQLVWLQCQPCAKCFKQSTPIYNPTLSSTYHQFSCYDWKCHLYYGAGCDGSSKACTYNSHYADGSISLGVLATETFLFIDETAFDKKVRFENFIFGCGHYNIVSFGGGRQMGIVGLDRYSLSLISQFKAKKFSHCFVPFNKESYSHLRFGDEAILTGPKTPLLDVLQNPAFYYITLNGISVNEDRLSLPEDVFKVNMDGSGGFFTDTGLSISVLKTEAFEALVNAVASVTGLDTADDRMRQFSLCFVVNNEDDLKLLPYITYHFDGLDMKFSITGTYIRNVDKLVCLAIVPDKKRSVLGNFQIHNFNIGYDLQNSLLYIDARQSCQGL